MGAQMENIEVLWAKDFGSVAEVDHTIHGLSCLSFLPLGIPDKENVSSHSLCLTSVTVIR